MTTQEILEFVWKCADADMLYDLRELLEMVEREVEDKNERE